MSCLCRSVPVNSLRLCLQVPGLTHCPVTTPSHSPRFLLTPSSSVTQRLRRCASVSVPLLTQKSPRTGITTDQHLCHVETIVPLLLSRYSSVKQTGVRVHLCERVCQGWCSAGSDVKVCLGYFCHVSRLFQ